MNSSLLNIFLQAQFATSKNMRTFKAHRECHLSLYTQIISARWCRSALPLTFDSPSPCLLLIYSRENNKNRRVAQRRKIQ